MSKFNRTLIALISLLPLAAQALPAASWTVIYQTPPVSAQQEAQAWAQTTKTEAEDEGRGHPHHCAEMDSYSDQLLVDRSLSIAHYCHLSVAEL